MFICFIFNGAILYLVTYIVKQKRPFINLVLGTLLATLFVPIVVYFPQSFFNTIIGKVLYSIGIITITIGLKPIHHLFKSLVTFYLVSFVAGGAILSVHYVLDYSAQHGLRHLLLYVDNIYHTEISLVIIVLGFPITLFMTKVWSDKLIISELMTNQLYNVTLTWNNRQFSTLGFVDSGNHLVDPLTNRPVIICDEHFLQQFFSKEDWNAIKKVIKFNEPEHIPVNLLNKLSIIPFQTVANSHYLYAIKPDKLLVQSNNNRIVTTNVLVGIQLSSITNDHQYHCLLHPELVALAPSELVT